MKLRLSAMTSQKFFAFLSLVVFLGFFSVDSQAQDGEKLFKSYCASCHSPGTNKLVGPGLAGINEKYDKEWLHSWIKDSPALIASGDADAIAIFQEFNQLVMPPQPVNDEEIDAILTYIDESNVGTGAPSEEFAQDPVGPTGSDKDGDAGFANFWTVVGIIVLLLIVIISLRKIQHSMQVVIAEKEEKDIPEERSFWQSILDTAKRNMTVVVILIIVGVVILLNSGFHALLGIGVYKGYEPEQPIRFSHELHAGQNGIDCNYCHTSASFSKTAGIPSPSLCMNCHAYIQEGPQYGKEEIAKIYEALDYDPVTQTYGSNQKPIQWVKVHNLPDHVYFNHSQHVTIGKIQCQECHGPVETYTVGKQFTDMTMGWCVDCHKTTRVQMDGNGYYDEIHARLPEHLKKEFLEDGTISVAELGGLECAKCHY